MDPYILLYTSKVMQCSILNDYEIANIDAEYMGADGFEELRVYGRYLFGKVE